MSESEAVVERQSYRITIEFDDFDDGYRAYEAIEELLGKMGEVGFLSAQGFRWTERLSPLPGVLPVSDSMVESVADVLLNAGCGTSDECERIAISAIAAMREEHAALRLALQCFAGPPETSEAERAVPNDSPVTIRCQLGDLRRAWAALSSPSPERSETR